MRVWPLPLAALLLVGAADRQQQPKSELPTVGETIEVSIVNVDVAVTDRAGNRVRGLTRDDFDVFENGQKQPITNFAEYSERASALTAGSQPAHQAAETAPQRRTIVVFVERFRLPKVKADPVFDSMKKLLHEAVRPGDAAMVVTWNRGELKTLQGYTDDLALVDRAIDSVAHLNTSAQRDELAETRNTNDDVVDMELESEAFARSAIGGADGEAAANAMRASFDDLKGSSQRMDALRARAEMEQKVRTINALMRSMAGFDGKRVLLLATHRLSQVAGAEFLWTAGANAELDSLDRIEFDTGSIVRSLYETANANGVTIYPMFPEGLGDLGLQGRPGGDPLQSTSAGAIEYLIQNNEIPSLKEVAQQTGGVAAWGVGDATRVLEQVREDLDDYYSLAYRTTPRSLDKARSIVVKTKDPKLVVRSRREVIEKSDNTRMEDRVLASLFRPDPGARLKFGVKFGVKLGDKQPQGRKYRIPVTIRIPISALTVLPNGPNYSGGFSVYIAWGAKIGGISEATHRRQLFHIPADEVDRAKHSYYTYQFDIAADARTERISLGVVDEVSREYGLRVYDLK